MAMRVPLRGNIDRFFDRLKDQLGAMFLVVISLWAMWGLDVVVGLFGGNLSGWLAMRPRQLVGLPGIFTMPFAHANFWHLAYNTWGLIIAIALIVILRPQSWLKVLGAVYLMSGLLTWLFGSGTIVGASGVVLGLVCFLVAPGVLLIGWWGIQKVTKHTKPCPIHVQIVPLVVSVLIAIFYLQNLFFNLVPIPGLNTGNNTSWSAHWCGAIAGLAVAFVFYKSEDTAETSEKSLVEESLA